MGYWSRRRTLKYYQIVQDIVGRLSGDSIVDVGGWDTPVVLSGDFKRRTVVNLRPVENRLDGVEYQIVDFLKWDIQPFDVVLCLQVLEHLKDQVVERFAKRLFEVAREWVVISVPFQWPEGACQYHFQDPVDVYKLQGWTGHEPSEFYMADDGELRMINVYDLRNEGRG